MPVMITKQPQNFRGPVGVTALFTVDATGDGLTYSWQILKAGASDWAGTTMPGNKTATLSVEARLDRSGNRYRCTVIDASGAYVRSEAAMLTVDNSAEFLIRPDILSEIADAIRDITGETGAMTPETMAEKIRGLGGGAS